LNVTLIMSDKPRALSQRKGMTVPATKRLFRAAVAAAPGTERLVESVGPLAGTSGPGQIVKRSYPFTA